MKLSEKLCCLMMNSSPKEAVWWVSGIAQSKSVFLTFSYWDISCQITPKKREDKYTTIAEISSNLVYMQLLSTNKAKIQTKLKWFHKDIYKVKIKGTKVNHLLM